MMQVRRNRAKAKHGMRGTDLGKHGKSSIVTFVCLWSCHDAGNQGLSTMGDRDVSDDTAEHRKRKDPGAFCDVWRRGNRPIAFVKFAYVHVSSRGRLSAVGSVEYPMLKAGTRQTHQVNRWNGR